MRGNGGGGSRGKNIISKSASVLFAVRGGGAARALGSLESIRDFAMLADPMYTETDHYRTKQSTPEQTDQFRTETSFPNRSISFPNINTLL